jgi:hypothetical protein
VARTWQQLATIWGCGQALYVGWLSCENFQFRAFRALHGCRILSLAKENECFEKLNTCQFSCVSRDHVTQPELTEKYPTLFTALWDNSSRFSPKLQMKINGMYNRIFSTNSPASAANKVTEPGLMSRVGRVREIVCA